MDPRRAASHSKTTCGCSTTGQIVDTEEVLEREGKICVSHVRKMPLRDAAGQVAGVITVARDITARRESEQEMRRLTAILDATPDFVVMMSPAGSLLYANQAARACIGIIPGTVLSNMNLRNHVPERVARVLLTEAMPKAANRAPGQARARWSVTMASSCRRRR